MCVQNLGALKPFFMRVFFGLKDGPFSQKAEKKRQNLTQSKTDHFHHLFFVQLLFDTATLRILELRMLNARGCKQRLKSDVL